MTRWVRETVITALIVVLVLAWWRDRERSQDSEALAARLDAYSDSLEASRARERQLALIGDSLRTLQAKRDTVYLRGKTIYVAVSDSAVAAAADPATAAEDLRAHITALAASSGTAIAACEAARETCNDRAANAEAERDEAKRQQQLAADSSAVELKRVEDEKQSVVRDLWRQRLYTVGAALVALASWILQ